MNHIPDTGKMVETPRTDAESCGTEVLEHRAHGDYVTVNFARQLERELQDANRRVEELEEYARKLEEAGDLMHWYCADPDAVDVWNQAKETNQ